MDETVLKVAIAGFMHDIGKFAEDALYVSEKFLNDNADLYQPHYQGRYTHKHAVYTAAFIDHIEKLLPKAFNRTGWGLEDTFINLAAGHHKPETSMQWIIAMADRISSGWDRDSFDKKYNHAVAWQDYRKTRLLPILECLMREVERDLETSDNYSYCYPLKEISPENIFPRLKDDICPKDNQTATGEYEKLFKEFIYALEHLLHKEDNLELWFDHFDNLMMIFTSSIPGARAGHIIPDVSLYDHSKITAALAVAIYLYHQQKDSMNVGAIKDYDAKKFLLVSGDFYGIQNFIFSDSGEAGKGRAKILRGRSFAVSLFSELAADMLCREIGISSTSILLNAAGKFTIIAPNTKAAKDAVVDVESNVNDWLMKISYGENAIGMTSLEASPEDLVSGKFIELWNKLNEKMEKKKFQKINLDKVGGTIEGYLGGFHNDLNRPLCPFCGKRPSSPELENSDFAGGVKSICRVCRDHIFLGKNLVNLAKKNKYPDKNKKLAIAVPDANIKGDRLLESIFGEYQVFFPDGKLNEMARSGQLLKYWDISINPKGVVAKDVTARFINGYVPIYRDEDFSDDRILESKKGEHKKEELIDQMEKDVIKTFENIANKALNPKKNGKGFCGIEALGILKADVDHLGVLMTCGLKSDQFTISRLATLSRQLNSYFAVYLPHLLKTDQRFMDIYTVFAGGDDLFLIGPWNRIVELVGLLRESFADYVCHNDEIHFSAGISLQKPHTPLDRLSDAAEAAIEKSKENKEDRNERGNQITLFSETAKWDEFMRLTKIKYTLQEWRDKELINNAMIYRLNDFIRMAELEKQIIKAEEGIHIEDVECLKWPALFCYSAERNVGKSLKGEAKREMINDFSKTAVWLKEYGSKLKIALWDIIYNYR
ncbi:MAG: type III-A CRISPR-associated protein Cas10/Csm1 [Desulfobacterales bacterium]|nr:type III-A CRISPR-associated protein Cas10/Csm1 [Desulfobacterales bacterium]